MAKRYIVSQPEQEWTAEYHVLDFAADWVWKNTDVQETFFSFVSRVRDDLARVGRFDFEGYCIEDTQFDHATETRDFEKREEDEEPSEEPSERPFHEQIDSDSMVFKALTGMVKSNTHEIAAGTQEKIDRYRQVGLFSDVEALILTAGLGLFVDSHTKARARHFEEQSE